MPDLLLFAVPGLPLALAALLLVPVLRGIVVAIAPVAALPALAVALGSDRAVSAPWLLLGTEFAVDETRRAFLLFTAALWTLAALAAARQLASDPSRTGFLAGFLLAMAGNFGLLIAADAIGFYALFALMSFASYALVVHGRRAADFFAGRVYIAFVVLGELALFAGLVMAGTGAQSTLISDIRASDLPPLATALLLVGLSVKLGIVPLHLWLPLAHSAAPAPASAVLSGAMIKAGLFGIVVLVPLGVTALPQHGAAMMAAGAVSIVLAALVGVTQTNAKTVLAYSSVSQMGLVAVALGSAMAAPQAWPAMLPVLVFFAAHHGLAKGALFLGVGAVTPGRRWLSVALLLVPAAALAAGPFTGGAIAKAGLKAAAPPDSADLLVVILSLSSVATALLMVRLFVLLFAKANGNPTSPLPAALAVFPVIALPVLWPMATGYALPPAGSFMDAIGPIAGALLLAGAFAGFLRLSGVGVRSVPPGEILALFERRSPRGVRLPSLPKPSAAWVTSAIRFRPGVSRPWQAGTAATLAVLLVIAALQSQPRITDLGQVNIEAEPSD